MKKVNLLSASFIFVILLFQTACGGGKNFELSSTSPNAKAEVKLSGTKANFADPYMVDITIKGYQQDRTISREIYASQLSTENTKIEWKDDNNCLITFQQQDDTTIKLSVYIGEDGLQLQEVK